MLIKSLVSLGISENQAKVYLSLLELGSAAAGEITKKSGVNRTNVYDALERLTERGLVSYVMQANIKYFEAKELENLFTMFDDEERAIEEKRRLAKEVLPRMTALRALNKAPQEATIYKGKKGLQAIAEDVIKRSEEVLVFGAEGRFRDLFDHYFEQWHVKRQEKKISLRILYSKKVEHKLPFANVRYAMHLENTPATTWIYADKVAIIVWSPQPLATLIRSEEVVQSYKLFFEALWQQAKE